jgi:hypothetical protein
MSARRPAFAYALEINDGSEGRCQRCLATLHNSLQSIRIHRVRFSRSGVFVSKTG